MGDKDLNTILEKESNEVIKSSVEDLGPIPSEFEDTSESDSECDLPSCDDFSPIDVQKGNFPNLLVTPLSDANEDECLHPGGDVDEIEVLLHQDPSTLKMSVVSILKGFTNEFPLEENDDLFDLESKRNEWNKILYDALIDYLMTEDKIFNPGGDIDEIDDFLDIDIYFDSEGDVLYLESLLSDDTPPNLPPKEFLDRDQRSLSDTNNLKIMVKVFNLRIHEKKISPTYVSLPLKDHHYLFFTYVI
nr:hypothetical protein [Tanacetum cinerariifolium]